MPKTKEINIGWDGVHYPEENGSWEFLMTECTLPGLPQNDGLEQLTTLLLHKEDNVKIFLLKQELHTNMDSL
jgi:hypothetical protein